MIAPQDITGLILAGGLGSRMGGIDKGLQTFQGQALALYALQRLQPQVGHCLINANRHLETYQSFGVPVYPDVMADYPGPLAGFVTGLTHCTTPWLLTVPCDSPYFPLDLAQRMAHVAEREGVLIVLAAQDSSADSDPEHSGAVRPKAQPVFALLHRDLLSNLKKFVADGGRKIQAWSQPQGQALCHFSCVGNNIHSFSNINTLQELQALEMYRP